MSFLTVAALHASFLFFVFFSVFFSVFFPPLFLFFFLSHFFTLSAGATGSNGIGLQIIEMKPDLSANDGINKKSSSNILSDFTVGMEVTVLLKNELRNGRVTSVSLEDGINIKYENGDEGSYLANKLKKMIELGEARVRQEEEEASAGETKERDAANLLNASIDHDYASMDVQEWLKSNFNIKTDLSAELLRLSIRTMYDLGNVSNEGFGTLATAMKPIARRRWMKDGKEKLAVIRAQESKEKKQRADHEAQVRQRRAEQEARDRQRTAAQQQQRAKNHDEEMKEIKETASKAKVRRSFLLLSPAVLPCAMSKCFFFFYRPFVFFLPLHFLFLFVTEHHRVDGGCWSATLSKIVVGRARLHRWYH